MWSGSPPDCPRDRVQKDSVTHTHTHTHTLTHTSRFIAGKSTHVRITQTARSHKVRDSTLVSQLLSLADYLSITTKVLAQSSLNLP